MSVGKQPQEKVQLPEGWWARLNDLCRSLWAAPRQDGERTKVHFDIYEFTSISRRSFSNAKINNEMTQALFQRMSTNIGYERQDELLADLKPPRAQPGSEPAEMDMNLPILEKDGGPEARSSAAPLKDLKVGLSIHSRPPVSTLEFRDRVDQTRRLAEAIKSNGHCAVLITGRSGIGKTALVERLFYILETDADQKDLHLIYISAAGSAHLSPDLICAHLERIFGGQRPHSREEFFEFISERMASTVLVLDQLECLLPGGTGLENSDLAKFVKERLRKLRNLKLILVCQEFLPSSAIGGGAVHIPLLDGLPDEDAKRFLLVADNDGTLALRDAPVIVDKLVKAAAGHPRILELIVASLADDPLLSPENVAADLFNKDDVFSHILGNSYAHLQDQHLKVLTILAVCGHAVPYQLISNVFGGAQSVDELMRYLARRHLVKIERIGRLIWIDRVDREFLLRRIASEADITTAHEGVARAARKMIEEGEITGIDADLWTLSCVDHFLAAGLPAEASATLSDPVSDRLEAHGLYDQLIRVYEKMDRVPSFSPLRRTSRLVHIHSLRGNLAEARRQAQSFLTQLPSVIDSVDASEFLIEMASVLRDTDMPRDGLAMFRKACRTAEDPVSRARALVGAAQIARRRGSLHHAKRWLEAALGEIGRTADQSFRSLQVQALARHHIASIHRFQGHPTAARENLACAAHLSAQAGDRGGEAYRLCLSAALMSDEFDIPGAISQMQLALGIYDEIGDDWGKAAASYAVAVLLCDAGDYEGARRSAKIAENLGYATNNTRVIGLISEVELACARRSQSASDQILQARSKCEASDLLLRSKGMSFYADRVVLAVYLHDLVMKNKTEKNMARLTTEFGRRLIRQWSAVPLTSKIDISNFLRPLSSKKNQRLPAGMQWDSDHICAGIST